LLISITIPYRAIDYASHFENSIRHEFGAIPGAFFESILEEVRRFTQPPRSGEPGFPGSSGSYFAEEV
jgi:hypothetical protein